MNSSSDAVRILVVENNKSRLHLNKHSVSDLGFQNVEMQSNRTAINSFIDSPADLIVIDLDRNVMDGLRLLHEFKKHDPEIVVIFTSTRISLETSLAALRGGAFDIHIKSAQQESFRQTIARGINQANRIKKQRQILEELCKNMNQLVQTWTTKLVADAKGKVGLNHLSESHLGQNSSETIKIGGLSIHLGRNQVETEFGDANLTPTEFEIMLYLFFNRERIVKCAELISKLRGFDVEEQEARILIRPHVSNLRSKLSSIQTDRNLIENVRGIGYRFSQEHAR